MKTANDYVMDALKARLSSAVERKNALEIEIAALQRVVDDASNAYRNETASNMQKGN